MTEIFKVHLLSHMFLACLMETKQSGCFHIAAVRLAAAFTLFVYISKWNALCSNNKFENYWILGIVMQLVKYLTHFQPSPCMNKMWRFFSVPNSMDPGKNYDSIHIRCPDYESILTSIHRSHEKLCLRQNR